jgi:hypothetical protein
LLTQLALDLREDVAAVDGDLHARGNFLPVSCRCAT